MDPHGLPSVLVSNSYSLNEDLPSLMFGLRGRINLTVAVTSQNPDLHSGMMGGISVSPKLMLLNVLVLTSVQSEPLIDLTRVLATLIEAKSAKVNITGFYDQVRKLDKSVTVFTVNWSRLTLSLSIRSEEEVYDEIIERCPEDLLRNLVQHSSIHDVRAALIKS
jgi:di- and tripeptidase